MIDSILIKNVASFNGDGIHINDLQKINFIYGANGSGKTTISNFITDNSNPEYQDCSLVWQDNQPLKGLVYNKKFRENNFGKGTIEGVFTLGQATKEDVEVIERKQTELRMLKEEGGQKAETLTIQKLNKDNEEDNLKKESWTKIYKKYELDFKPVFKGALQKESFKNKLLDEFDNNTSVLLSIEELKEKAKIIFAKELENIPPLQDISFEGLINIENNEIWAKKIIGKSDVNIAKLIQKLNLNDWVNQGREYLQEDAVCPFCQQPTITDDFKKQLENYFDELFTRSINLVKELNEDYNLVAHNLVNELRQIETDERACNESNLNIDTFSAYLKIFSSQLTSNKKLLGNKIKEPSRSVILISSREQVVNIEQLIAQANEKIKKHNNIVANYKTERARLIQAVWRYIVEENRDDIEKYNTKVGGLQKGIDNLEKDLKEKRGLYTNLSNEISDLTKNVTSVQHTVDEINRILSAYGFLNFEIVPSGADDNYYQIKREDGTLAESTLSEGEITFITFLYFLQLAKGSTNKETIAEERVLVVDDPVSSLDSNVLFVVSTLLKKIIQDIKEDKGNIKQLILLTHNVYFHKEVSFINARIIQNKNTLYWILRKNGKVSSIQPYGMKNPIQTSYELLWQEIKNKERNSGITIQNTMRRIIENYFKILGQYGDDKLIEKFTTKEEQEICRSLICWTNDGSHCMPDDLFIETQSDVTDKYLNVFRDIFVLTNHKGHYDMMMGIDNSALGTEELDV